MAPKHRSRSSLDADAVARMMREQEGLIEPSPDRDEVAPDEAPPQPVAQPEPTPAAPSIQAEAPAAPSPGVPAAAPATPAPPAAPAFDPGQVDGRTLRRTGREPFATRIKPETHAALKRIAYARGITIAEALETAVAEFERR